MERQVKDELNKKEMSRGAGSWPTGAFVAFLEGLSKAELVWRPSDWVSGVDSFRIPPYLQPGMIECGGPTTPKWVPVARKMTDLFRHTNIDPCTKATWEF